MYTGEHANIFKVVEENHLTKKQGCVYTFAKCYFSTHLFTLLLYMQKNKEKTKKWI